MVSKVSRRAVTATRVQAVDGSGRHERRDQLVTEGTETTTERRIAFSPEIPGPRIGEARSEWEIFVDLARRVDPEWAHVASFASGHAIREEISRVVPSYEGVEQLRDTGDAVQWGGPRLCEGPAGPEFPTADGKARFTVVRPPPLPSPVVGEPNGRFRLATRRGKQFNTMLHSRTDPLTGAKRDSVFMAVEDAARLGVDAGAPVLLRSEHGELRARVHPAPIRPGNVQVHFPEANVLIASGRRDPDSDVPDYNAFVEVVPL